MRDADAFHSCAFCRRQAHRVEELEERIRQLTGELHATEYVAPHELGLSMTQTRMLGLMLRHDRVVSGDTLFEATRNHMTRKTEPDQKLMQVQIWKLREKLEPFGLTIETIFGFGWRLSAESRAKLQHWPQAQEEAA